MPLTIATCQFPTTGKLHVNLRYILRLMRSAAEKGADVAHFCESALDGYAGSDMPSNDAIDWEAHDAAVHEVMDLSRRLSLWVILGATHRLTGKHLPHNSVYVIDSRGKLVDRYDKRFCTGPPDGKAGDLTHFTPGDHFVTFDINGVCCGVLICHDFRYVELYREYHKLGVKMMFHSYYNTVAPPATRKQLSLLGTIVPACMQAYAANYLMHVSATNSARQVSCWGGFFVTPDGTIADKVPRGRTGMIVNVADPDKAWYDGAGNWRSRAMCGVYNSGKLVKDARSRDRKLL